MNIKLYDYRIKSTKGRYYTYLFSKRPPKKIHDEIETLIKDNRIKFKGKCPLLCYFSQLAYKRDGSFPNIISVDKKITKPWRGKFNLIASNKKNGRVLCSIVPAKSSDILFIM